MADKMAKPPGYIRDSLKRQYSGKDYTIEDKKNVINWYKKLQAKKKKRGSTRNA